MLLNLIFGRPPENPPRGESILVGTQPVPVLLVRNPRARRYLLRLTRDGAARVTIPRGGSAGAAMDFARRQTHWLAKQLQQLREHPPVSREWTVGSVVWFRGEPVPVAGSEPGRVQVGSETIKTGAAADLRPAIQFHLRRLASRELPPRVLELASVHQVAVARVSVRNQRSRWGSCSRSGGISLNWRLIQTPAFVSDYIILHELMHRREMNHSSRFWREVAAVCPDYKAAKRWLKQHSAMLRD